MGDWLKQRKKTVAKRPNIITLYSIEGGGKTSWGAQFPGACFAMTDSETGLLKLMEGGLVPDCDYFPEWRSWADVVGCSAELIESKDRPRTLVVDTINGAQWLLVDHICETKYGGEMTKKGFLNYQEGWSACLPEWRRWLSQLDRLRNLGTTVVLLAHAKATTFKNPTGENYFRYVADLHEELWSAVRKFSDVVAFLNFHTEVHEKTGKGGRTRVYHFQRDAAFDAKDRLGLPASITGKGSSSADFAKFVEAVKAGSKRGGSKPKKEQAEPESEPESATTSPGE